ncbi:MAG TPA: TrkA family potassium uptake protein [Oscillatoriaceae cyanobacterium]
MYIVIAGGGLMGLTLAERLVAHRHDVMVIDPAAAVCEYAQTEIGTMVHQGSATNTKTLDAAGLRRADIAVGIMRDDAANLAFILLAKSYGVPRRLVRLREPDFEQAYRLAGATAIAHSVDPVVDQLMLQVEYPEIKALMHVGRHLLPESHSDVTIFEVAIPPESHLAGEPASQAVLPPGVQLIAAETPDGGFAATSPTMVLQGGANVILLARERDLEGVLKTLTQPRASQ